MFEVFFFRPRALVREHGPFPTLNDEIAYFLYGRWISVETVIPLTDEK